ncbi:MAG: hypothetical protein IPG04_16865 [Polyangiaceae bacterium]|nr:hypothetical protein [Polyangiaceae bacterium]
MLAEVAAHLRKNAARLEYSRLRRQDLDISSGIIEGRYVTSSVSGSTAPACGGVAIAPRPSLQLRCVLINGLWGDFEQFLGARRVRLAAQPVPTRTHDAVLKKAA